MSTKRERRPSNDEALWSVRHFAAHLRSERERQGLSQQALVDELAKAGFGYIQQPAIAQLEKGPDSLGRRRELRLDEALAICRVLGVRLGDMLIDPALGDRETREAAAEIINALGVIQVNAFRIALRVGELRDLGHDPASVLATHGDLNEAALIEVADSLKDATAFLRAVAKKGGSSGKSRKTSRSR